MADAVDILIINYNTLPWLKLLFKQISHLKPSVPINPIVWDNASTDGSIEWLACKGIRHHLHPVADKHFTGLKNAIKLSSAPYVAFMDADAFPIADGWLDQTVDAVKHYLIGAAGLGKHIPWGGRRKYVHPSFCVFRRELYDKLSLDPSIEEVSGKFTYDVGEKMCKQIEDAGYRLIFFGCSDYENLKKLEKYDNKVIHGGGAAGVLRNETWRPEWIKHSVDLHRSLLLRLGLWEEFVGYLRESAPVNPLCARYF